MITCDECGRENDDEYKFCLGCGAALEKSEEEQEDEQGGSEIINCPYCGAEQPTNFKFCGACGEKIPQSLETQGDEQRGAGQGAGLSTSPGKPGAEQSASNSNPGGAAQSAAETSEAEIGQGEPPPMPSDLPDAEKATSGGAVTAQAEQRSGGAGAVTAQGDQRRSSGEAATAQGDEQVAAREPDPNAVARLIVIRPDGTEGASIDVPEDNLSIGRASKVDALSSDPFLSPEHAVVEHDNGNFLIKDQDSLNGVFREVTNETPLSDGDLIRIGQELIRFEKLPSEPHAGEDPPLEAGSPRPDTWGRLSLIAGPDVQTQSWVLEEDEVTLGRESGDIVFKDDGFVSGTHAQVANMKGQAMLRDLNSSNGTFIRIRGEHPVQDGERVLMGQQLFRLEVK